MCLATYPSQNSLTVFTNEPIFKMLGGNADPPWPELATIFATLKFTLIFGAIGFIVIGAPPAMYSWWRSG